MSRTLLKDALRSITANRLRFISIIIIVALGTGFFVGIKSSPTALRDDANSYFVTCNVMDVKVTSSIVFTEDDVQKIEELDSVDNVEKSMFVDGTVSVGENVLIGADSQPLSCRISSADFDMAREFSTDGTDNPHYMNRLVLSEGSYPTAANECVIDKKILEKFPEIKIGTVISVSGDETTISDSLRTTEFRVTGAVDSPLFISTLKDNTTVTTGSLNTFIYVPADAFALSEANELFVKMKDSDSLDRFSEEYRSKCTELANRIQSLSKVTIDARLTDLKNEYAEKISVKETEISEYDVLSGNQLAEMNARLDELKSYVNTADETLEKTKAEDEAEIANAKAALDKSTQEYNSAKKQYETDSAEFDKKSSEIKGYKELKKLHDDLSAKHDSDEAKLNVLSDKLDSESTVYENKKTTVSNLTESADNARKRMNAEKAEADKLPSIKTALDNLNSRKKQIENQIETINRDLSNPDLTDLQRRNAQRQLKTEQSNLDSVNAELKTATAQRDKAETAKTNYEKYKQELDETNQKLSQAQSELDYAQTAYNNAKSNYTSAKDSFDSDTNTLNKYQSSLNELTSGQSDVARLASAMETGKSAYDSATVIYTQDKIRYVLAQKNAKRAELQAQYDLAKAKREYDDVSAEYKQLDIEINNHKNGLSGDLKSLTNTFNNLDSLVWTATAQSELKGSESFKASLDNMKSMTIVFPAVFLVVAMLACFVIMIKNVEDERSQIGVFKAIGYSDMDVTVKFLFYAFLAWLAGMIVGLLFGVVVLPWAIYTIYDSVYTIPAIKYAFNVRYIIIGACASFVTTLLATFAAAYRELAHNPSELMRPKTVAFNTRSVAERVPGLWNRLSYGMILIVRTITRSRRRIAVGTFGIACCAALVLSSIGLVNSAVEVSRLQYGKNGIFRYDTQLSLSAAQDKENSELADRIKNDIRIDKSVLVSKSAATVSMGSDGGNKRNVNLIVPSDDSEMNNYISFDVFDGTDSLEADGMIITRKLSQLLGAEVGDRVFVTDTYGRQSSVEITGIANNYINHYAYMSEKTYNSVFEYMPEYRFVFLNYKDYLTADDINNVNQDFMRENIVVSISSASDMADTADTSIERVLIVVSIFVVAACLLAFIIMYTISNINLSERAREIANIKVIGFSDNEVLIYVIRENLVSSVLGIIIGLIFGVFLHKALIGFITVENIMYNSHIFWWGYFVMILIVGLLAVISALPIRFKINKVNMAETLKMVD